MEIKKKSKDTVVPFDSLSPGQVFRVYSLPHEGVFMRTVFALVGPDHSINAVDLEMGNHLWFEPDDNVIPLNAHLTIEV